MALRAFVRKPPHDAGSPPQTSPGHSGPAEGPAGDVKTPKVFRLTPSRPTPVQEEPQAELFTNEGASENVGADSSASAVSAPSSVAPIRRRRRNPVTAPVLVRHVVFEKPAVEAPQIQQPDLEAPADSQASYGTVMNALQQLRDEVGTLRKVQQLLADLDLSTR